ncbi:MAG: Dam family site-specific DNA-(adenine-N6)-methyltransferase [Paludibacteraceae bacterium]|nr:Dam family site-specific DNA-(adenine-N6)-methyltransferase [Paludibacteraceae bacterium]
MLKEQSKSIVAKPFVKWAGGKGSLVKQLKEYLPSDFIEQQDITYVEPFIGGGAMLFYMLTHYPNIKRAIINDINEDLINCYLLIRDNPMKLISLLRIINNEYYKLATIDEKKQYYYSMREKYNNVEFTNEERLACFIFLNKTCFNGLYRVNANGKFNVPFGNYKRPNICDEQLIMADHKVLQKVDIYVGEYKNVTRYLGKRYNFIYIDPPYRPLSESACFIEYTHNVFDDTEQEKLKAYCDRLTQMGCKIMQSNSNSIDDNGESYFAKLYNAYTIKQILAHRFINAHAGKREKETELLIMNY